MTRRELPRRAVLGGLLAVGVSAAVVATGADTTEDREEDGSDTDDSGTDDSGADDSGADGEGADAFSPHEALCTCPVCMGGAAPGGF